MNGRVVLSFDADWCPDWMLLRVLDLLGQGGHRGVFFLTGRPGPELARRLDADTVQKGIHPNFLDAGLLRDPAPAIQALLDEVGPVTACRTHGLVWWYGLAQVLAAHGIREDSSCIHPLQACSKPLRIGRISQFPIFWGDSWFLNSGAALRDFTKIARQASGCAVFNFHPVHIAANTASPGDWQAMRPHLSDPAALDRVMREIAARGRYGVGDMFRELLEMTEARETVTLAQAAARDDDAPQT